MVRALDIKLWRDLRQLWAQVLTIAVVVAIGVAGFVGMFAVYDSLLSSRDAFYRDNRFADVFVAVKRAPLAVRGRLAAVPGVAEVKTEVVFDAQVDLPGVATPVSGRFVGLDLARAQQGRQGLNALTLLSGRWPEADGPLEAVVTDRFAVARGLRPGDVAHAILAGRREAVRIVGTVATPEYVFAMRGDMPDDESFGVWWIDDERMTRAFDMTGAFNRAALRLHPGAASAPVIAQVDHLLARFGALGATGRDLQMSHKIVTDELSQLRVMGTVLPGIFLAVAMFILNVVLHRQVTTQRAQIASLKALGYANAAIARHYVRFALVIALLGVALGLLGSQAIGRLMLWVYAEVFRFGHLAYATAPWLIVTAALIAVLCATLGAWTAIRTVVRLQPAQAMQPPVPAGYRPTLIERLGYGRHVTAAARMVVRNVERRPLRAGLTVLGIAAAVALQISGAFWLDAIAHIVDVQFRQVQQGDVWVDFDRPMPATVVNDLRRLPGVIDAEGYRNEPVRLQAGARRVDTVLSALPAHGRLLRVVDEARGPLTLPAQGAVASALLARELGLRPGDRVTVAFRLWNRRVVEVEIVDIVHTQFGKALYMELAALNRLARDGDGVTHAALHADLTQREALWQAVKSAPFISAVVDKDAVVRAFNARTERNMGVFSGILTAFAVAMAVGIIYNAARIALSERAWELASLRVLGMTRREVSVLLLAELAVELLLALPVGAALGWALAHLLMRLMSSDAIDFPVVIAPATYAGAALVVLAAGVVSAWLVRRHIDRLDLVAVLKVRE